MITDRLSGTGCQHILLVEIDFPRQGLQILSELALLDLNCECKMSHRMSEEMSQIECQRECKIECPNICDVMSSCGLSVNVDMSENVAMQCFLCEMAELHDD